MFRDFKKLPEDGNFEFSPNPMRGGEEEHSGTG